MFPAGEYIASSLGIRLKAEGWQIKMFSLFLIARNIPVTDFLEKILSAFEKEIKSE